MKPRVDFRSHADTTSLSRTLPQRSKAAVAVPLGGGLTQIEAQGTARRDMLACRDLEGIVGTDFLQMTYQAQTSARAAQAEP